uniref:Glutathione S-transferase n=1 Tax=Aegilops tauschii subsp. strangulata TaxID=200361 RepID=A0A453GNA5_AEGTS
QGRSIREEDEETLMAGDAELKLLGWWAPGVSPYVLRAQMALAVKGLSYEYLPEDRWSKSDLLVASNPVYKKVPVLIHDGRPVCESLHIVEYLDDAPGLAGNGTSILPADPYSHAVARFWAAYVNDKVSSSFHTQITSGCAWSYISISTRFVATAVPFVHRDPQDSKVGGERR